MDTIINLDALPSPTSSPSSSSGMDKGACTLGALLHQYRHDKATHDALLGAALVNMHRYYDPRSVFISSDICATAEEARALLSKYSWHLYDDNEATYEVVVS